MTNKREPMINPVKATRLKVLTSLNQKVCSRLLLSTIGSTRTKRLPGESWGLRHCVRQAEHGKPVFPPRKRQADRKGGCWGCGQAISEKANVGL